MSSKGGGDAFRLPDNISMKSGKLTKLSRKSVVVGLDGTKKPRKEKGIKNAES